MYDLGVIACVSDESITDSTDPDYEPITPYHGVYSNIALNGYVSTTLLLAAYKKLITIPCYRWAYTLFHVKHWTLITVTLILPWWWMNTIH
jgi:hypothetical protein